MEKKIARFILIVAILLFFIPFCYSQSEDSMTYEAYLKSSGFNEISELPADGIYHLDGVSLRFIAPEKWSVFFDSKSTILIFYSSQHIRIQLLPEFQDIENEKDVQARLQSIIAAEYCDYEIGNKETVNFASSTAQSYILIPKAEKFGQRFWRLKLIALTRENRGFLISYLIGEELIDKLLSEVDKILNSFEIISPAPK